MAFDTLGTSLAYPLRPNGRGGLAVVSGITAVEHSLRAIIESIKGSHAMEPWLGVPSFVFKPMPDVHAAAQLIKEAIISAEDRIDPGTLEVRAGIGDSGVFQVVISYQVKNDATARTLEHGFRTR
jgi:phage baseplate assembly protein W